MAIFGKSNAWQLWISDNLDRLMLYAKWQSRNESDAQDILQWVLEKTWTDFKKQGPDMIYPLVCKKIRHRTIDLYRNIDSRKKRDQKYVELTVIQSEESSEKEWFGSFVDAKESQKLLLSELYKLDADIQEIVILHIWNDLSFREISKVTGLSKSTAAEKYQKAILELKKQFKTIDEVCNF